MSNFTFMSCIAQNGQIINGLYTIQPKIFGDNRGYFMETWNAEFASYTRHLDGSLAQFVQDNESHSTKGVLRGLHFQKTHPQGKLVRVITGVVYDVAVDLRKNSPTFGCYYGVTLSEENKLQFYVPEGFAHGFCVLSEKATFVYKCTRFYDPHDEGGIIWNDPDINIKWPLEATPILSEKDKKNPSFKELGFCYEA